MVISQNVDNKKWVHKGYRQREQEQQRKRREIQHAKEEKIVLKKTAKQLMHMFHYVYWN